MIIHRVTLQNVGVYRGTHSIDLTPPDSEHPITLIGALNGGGKTTLLGAVQLALYGNRSKGIERTKKGYQRHLQELINRTVPPEEGAAVEIEFERRIDGKPTQYKIRRAWSICSGAVEERIHVLRDGEPDALLADHWDESIDSFLPAKLAHLFFFDGEQIERMADEEEATKLLSSAFQSL
ncbi:MAG: DNA sulfur modification protein DndD, partial [Proteobacteria bacterium]|nr:DNA sulfur modification protein DndD [Pseudomonadota bacterium]